MGFDDDESWDASQQYDNIQLATEYIHMNRIRGNNDDDNDYDEKKYQYKNLDELLNAKYKTVDFEVFVAIDFGTHGTGLGYAIKKKKAKTSYILRGNDNDNDDDYEYETYIEQDWCGKREIKNKTDILLTHDGKFIKFGYEALEQLCNVYNLYYLFWTSNTFNLM